MKRKKQLKVVLIILVSFIVLFAALIVFAKNYEPTVYSKIIPEKNITVYIRDCEGIFGIGMMGNYEYRLVVKENKTFSPEIYNDTFVFGNDGAGLGDGNVEIKTTEDRVFITIDGCEMQPKTICLLC